MWKTWKCTKWKMWKTWKREFHQHDLPLRMWGPFFGLKTGSRGTPWNSKSAGPGGSENTNCRFWPFKWHFALFRGGSIFDTFFDQLFMFCIFMFLMILHFRVLSLFTLFWFSRFYCFSVLLNFNHFLYFFLLMTNFCHFLLSN